MGESCQTAGNATRLTQLRKRQTLLPVGLQGTDKAMGPAIAEGSSDSSMVEAVLSCTDD